MDEIDRAAEIELIVDQHKYLAEQYGATMASVMMLTGLTAAEIEELGGLPE